MTWRHIKDKILLCWKEKLNKNHNVQSTKKVQHELSLQSLTKKHTHRKEKRKKGEKRKRKRDEPVDAANKRIKDANIKGEFSKKHSSSAGHFGLGNDYQRILLTRRLLDP